LSKFDEWLRVDPVNRDDRLILPTIELGNMHDLMHIEGDNLSMNYLPESIVIVPDDYVLPTPVPVPVPVPAPAEKGVIRIVARLINPKEKEEVALKRSLF
jgi:hypothetical protein